MHRLNRSLVKRGLRLIKRSTLGAAKHRIDQYYDREYDPAQPFAEQPVDPASLSYFRAENFPPAGPNPWLDHADAPAQIEERLRNGLITEGEARLCLYWHQRGISS